MRGEGQGGKEGFWWILVDSGVGVWGVGCSKGDSGGFWGFWRILGILMVSWWILGIVMDSGGGGKGILGILVIIGEHGDYGEGEGECF